MLVGKIGSWIRTNAWTQQCFIPTIVWKSLMFVTGPLDCCQRTIRLLYFISDGLFCGFSGFFDINSYSTRHEHGLAVAAIEQLNHLGCWTLCPVSKTCIWKHNLFHIIHWSLSFENIEYSLETMSGRSGGKFSNFN